MATSGQVAVGLLVLLTLRGVFASSGMTRVLENLSPYYCDRDADQDSCRDDLAADPGSLLVKALYRLTGLQVPPSVSTRNRRASDEPVLSMLDCDFQPATMPGLPIPFLCDWETENNDGAYWEPGGPLFNGFTNEEGPPMGFQFFAVYAIARLSSPTATATTSLLAPLVDGRPDDIIVALLDFKYFLHGKPEDCQLRVKLLRTDGSRIQLWSTEDDFTEGVWNDLGLLQFYPPVPFQLVFESTLSPSSDVPYTALNDVKFSTGVLLSKYVCEGGTLFPESCGMIDLDGRWSYWSGLNASANNKGPQADHTLDDALGHFMINRNTKFGEQLIRTRARLQTPEYFKWSDQTACTFRFYYHAKGTDLGDMELTVSDDSGSYNYTVDLDDREQWVEHSVDLTAISGTYRVTLDVITASADNHIAIDDMEFLQEDCLGRQFCPSHPCMNGGTCWQTSPGSFGCYCADGYEGFNCDINIDECSLDSSLCANDPNRVCQNASPGYECVCKPNLMEYNGRCIASCLDNPCTRKDEACLQNDNGFSCQCQYGYIESGDGLCIRDKTDVKYGLTSYQSTVALGTYLGGGLVALLVAALVVSCYFSCCDRDEDEGDERKPDQAVANPYSQASRPGGSRWDGSGGAAAENGGFEMEGRGEAKQKPE